MVFLLRRRRLWSLRQRRRPHGLQLTRFPLETVEPGHGFGDLQSLKDIVGDRRVVALGESPHGTREFFQLKHRIFEFLVREMGFTVMGMETTMPEAFALNHYVLTGEGDPARALSNTHYRNYDSEGSAGPDSMDAGL